MFCIKNCHYKLIINLDKNKIFKNEQKINKKKKKER